MVLAAEAQAAQLKHPLPSRLPVLSMAAQAHLIVAVDTRNAVFLSRDDGRHWKAIRTQWQGRAVRTDLVKLPVGDRTGFSQDKEAGRVALQVAAAEPAGNLNSAEVAQARSLSVLPGSSLAGTVTDRTGAVIPGATVVVLDSATHTARAVRTDSAGRYLVDGLAPGIYELEARSPGFKKETLAAVAVAASQPAIANLSLTVGAATQTVTVTSAPPLETEAVGASAKEISVSKKTKARLAVPSQPTPVFEITTDNGERWTSADGVTWKHN
jgi:protocatechuate 3,4-dioxygenase beta subunit